MNDTHPAARSATAAQRTDLLHRMLTVRRFEESGAALPGTADLPAGEEAIAVGVVNALGPADTVVSASGAHGPARAVERARADLAEHVPAVTACFLGGDAQEEHELTECIDAAIRQGLPVLFCFANDEGTEPPGRATLPTETVDGLDVEAVMRTAVAMVHTMRAGTGPRLLDARPRHPEAGGSDDPIRLLADRMRNDHQLDDNALAAIDDHVAAQLRAALAGPPGLRRATAG